MSAFYRLTYSTERMLRKVMRCVILVGAYEATRRVLATDGINAYYIRGKLQGVNDMMRDIHQHTRKRELLSRVHGEVVELNASSGKTIPFLSPFISRYYSNEKNPYLTTVVQKELKSRGLPISVCENTDSLSLLKQLDSGSIDGVIMNGALRSEDSKNLEKLFMETQRVLRPGGVLYFMEDVQYPNQFAPLRKVRQIVRDFFTNETTHDFIPTLLNVYNNAYIEDWSKPHVGYDESHRSRVEVLLPYNQRQSKEDVLQTLEKNIKPWSIDFLHRPYVAGYAIKPTNIDKRNDPVVLGCPDMDALIKVRDCFNLKELDRQYMREKEAEQASKEAEIKADLEYQKSKDRLTVAKPTPPKGGYQENKVIPWNAVTGTDGFFPSNNNKH
eukprot:UN01168